MQYTKTWSLCGALILLFQIGFAQQKTTLLQGQVLLEQQPLAGATVRLQGQEAITDGDGQFAIRGDVQQSLLFEISAVGAEKLKKIVRVQAKPYSFNLVKSRNVIETIEVLGLAKVHEIQKQAFNVTAIDATKLYNTTLDIAGALDKVAGVRFRESGGVGSNFNLSLNGFSGNHIRYFLDGIPMDNFGSSFQINNIPINLAERIEVYKGVVPMWLGSDALGGAVNIVSSDKVRNYVDVSYSYGSFNTHRSVVNAAITSANGFTFRLNAYQNYSDNNYGVTVNAADINTGAYTYGARLKRFHDTYHNESIIASLGVVNKSYADRLLLGFTMGQNYKELQTGARMEVVFGGVHSRGLTLMPTLKYQKKNLVEGLDVTLNANYNFGNEQNIDTLNARFDWYGNQKPSGSLGGERTRQIYKYKNREGLANLSVNYRLTERHSLALNNVFTTFDRSGKNLLNPANDGLERPQKSNKNVLGFGYSYDLKDHWSATVFGKYINQFNEHTQSAGINTGRFGYGLASSYYVNPNWQLKTSYELTNRVPTAFELYGDVENQEANANLKPERSHNVNLGTQYGFRFLEDHKVNINANVIYRYSYDFIYNRLNNNQTKLIADNREGVSTIGVDADIRYSYRDFLTLGGNLTYQFLRNQQKYEPDYTGISPVYLDRMPNIPYLFGNFDASLILRDLGRKGNSLNISYNLLYVYKFYLNWPSRGGSKLEIPKQLSHDINLVYSLKQGRYNLGLECRNIGNANIYDNFSLQKPGRAVYANLRYFFTK